jgi:hypothetical protein
LSTELKKTCKAATYNEMVNFSVYYITSSKLWKHAVLPLDRCSLQALETAEERSISDPVQSKHKDIGDILLIKENDAGHLSSTSRRTSRPQGSQERMKESSLEDYTQLTSAPLSSETPWLKRKTNHLVLMIFSQKVL